MLQEHEVTIVWSKFAWTIGNTGVHLESRSFVWKGAERIKWEHYDTANLPSSFSAPSKFSQIEGPYQNYTYVNKARGDWHNIIYRNKKKWLLLWSF